MKKIIKSCLFLFILVSMIASSCKEDDEAPQTTPEWLKPYQGYYEGTFAGDDTGTWLFLITFEDQFEMFVTSNSDDKTYSRVITLQQNGSFSFADAEIILSGTITNFKNVAGLWEELTDDTNGTFVGEKQ